MKIFHLIINICPRRAQILQICGYLPNTGFQADSYKSVCDWLTFSQSLSDWLITQTINQCENPS